MLIMLKQLQQKFILLQHLFYGTAFTHLQ